MLPGGVAVLEGTSSIAPSQVRWTPATYLSAPSSLRTEARPPTTQWFSLEVITGAGCLAKDSALVTVLPALTIPNAFSPHLPDGINDVWVIRNLEFFTESMVTVYDRYGQEVYKSKGYSKAWDGKINGMLVPVGVYYYIVDPKQNNVKYSGSLTIL
jgi:gliding motility-associated-like protein